MARIDLIDVAHTYHPGADELAVKPMTISWSDGGAYALLGPSGCGKTTLLGVISGLITPTRGRVLYDGRDVTALAPEERNIAQVFQFPVVYDSMTVFDNLAFPLRNRGWKRAEIDRRVRRVAEMLELGPDLRRRARGLSADRKQKVSLGRGLVRPDVAAILFDEPLTVIDPHVKWLLRRKLKELHHELKLTLIYVTHDQTEALTFADRVLVMAQGEILQSGAPQELFEAPRHRFVGHFIGSPGMNFLDCAWQEGAALVGAHRIETSSRATPPSNVRLQLGVRPEYVELAPGPGPNCTAAAIISSRDEGVHTMAQMEIAGATLWAKLRNVRSPPSRGPAYVHLPAERCALYADDVRLP